MLIDSMTQRDYRMLLLWPNFPGAGLAMRPLRMNATLLESGDLAEFTQYRFNRISPQALYYQSANPLARMMNCSFSRLGADFGPTPSSTRHIWNPKCCLVSGDGQD